MPSAWRIVSARWSGNAFDGEGARLYGGRWNRPGKAVIYLAGSRALAALEMLVHLNRVAAQQTFTRFEVRFPTDLISEQGPDLPKTTIGTPMIEDETQRFGDSWLSCAEHAFLAVPSSIIPEEDNFLLDPRCLNDPKIEIGPPEPFAFDPRLLKA